MLGGVGLFIAGAVTAAAAPTLAVLLTGQVLLGTGAAALMPASLALISDAYPDDRRRAGAIAIFASASAVAIGAGPVLGGLLIDAIGSRAFDASAIAGLLLNFGVYGPFFVLSLYPQELRGRSPLQTGLIFLVQPATAAVTALAAGAITARRGPRIPTVAGGIVAAAGALLMASGGARSGYVTLIAGLMLLGAGGGLSVPALTVAVVSGSARDQVGVAAATFTASRQIGGILGVAGLGAMAQPLTVAGVRAAILVAAGALATSSLLGLLVPGVAVAADEMTVIEVVAAAEG
jgi:DHA2 family methylenomycin A resistance protein-like MFS transporter